MGHSVDLLITAGQCHNYRIIDLLLLACQLCVMRSQSLQQQRRQVHVGAFVDAAHRQHRVRYDILTHA